MNPWGRALLRTSWVTGAFVVLVFVGLVSNAIVARNADPTPPTQIDDLVTRLNQDPKNAKLLGEIRSQDVWLRETYLRSERFAGVGFLLLLGGVSAWLLCLKGARHLGVSAPNPDPQAPARAAQQNLRAQQSVLATGLLLGGGLVVVTVLSRHDAANAYVLDSRLPEAAPGARATSAGEPGGQPLAVLPPMGAPAAAPAPLDGQIPMPVPGGTSLQPLPTSPPGGTTGPTNPPAVPLSGGAIIRLPNDPGAWPFFRGVGAGAAAGAFPGSWDAASGKGVVWKNEVPLPGWGSPVVWGGHVFLSGGDAKTREVYAFDAKDGKLSWRTPVPILSPTAKAAKDAGFAPATVAVDAKNVVAAFVNGDVAGFDRAGKRLWSRAFGPMENEYGYASCPVLVDRKVILQLDQGASPEEGKSLLVALDPATGRTLWQVKRPVSAAWSTPIVASIGGRTVAVVCGNPLVIAYDVTDGKEMWRAEGMGGEVAPSATFGAGCVFVAQSGGQAMALRATDGKPIWTNYELALPDIASPAYASGLLFCTAPDGTLTALDAQNGKIVWEHAMGKPARSSPLIADGKVLLFGIDGVGRLVEAGRTFKLLASHPLGEGVGASPALVGGRLYVRTEKHLFCLGAR